MAVVISWPSAFALDIVGAGFDRRFQHGVGAAAVGG